MIAHPQVVGAAGFEPATSWSQTRRDDRTTLRPELISIINFAVGARLLQLCFSALRFAPGRTSSNLPSHLTIIKLRGGSEITSAMLQCSALCSGSNEFKSPFASHHNQTSRWERDSNSRYSYPYDSLANCWFQPLTHPTYALTDGKNKKSFCFFRILDEKK
jgi:hypothetical protein